MVTIKNIQFTSNVSLAAILSVMTKVQMLDICKKLKLYVSPNTKKYCKISANMPQAFTFIVN